ncbi:6,7-dimethyl-8-ribityllumazine synthase [Liquorilactobacillus satsumensis]|uniref:6,7-dimethyl-8-ribityllumazine synthase n=1 Tax=Liquorilactobacillus satsumensis DSM 16230 = JCM 12392 TaxID=1423801 RepID=A0A0R1UZY8_9LACO|nr:6,7-dimethyl-8-ribityllumazine synthase [Liquorilactobacillus satsumensis]KRL98871.1 6,7-dimethyl-8-ribityllumazine synthase [Liquorilactobacillus satsumensis DSM 16230 = JCM 12392]MCP9312788.1 6,7-dimethyl-8-ribityllumazine synthase [Liquorilactobacillus satsumensis]MCP9327946.1 6,7-dimethyl-8-ribityllumazine synthase [Liquorilactobacillus satsumensis]MCP9359198.1 6,7-dimethyl-8-ribityllumazine synthase [Liquorilactobacillus satsumensis]
MNEYLGAFAGKNRKIGIVVAKFNELVTQKLLAGAQQTLLQAGVNAADLLVIWVPGAFELPRVVRLLSESQRVAGIIALGAVVRGETSHYDYVCSETASGLAAVSLHGPVPVMFGVLTTDNLEQALNRAGGKAGNKGSECALGVLEMINLQEKLQQ